LAASVPFHVFVSGGTRSPDLVDKLRLQLILSRLEIPDKIAACNRINHSHRDPLPQK
jgi:hypothetical protein